MTAGSMHIRVADIDRYLELRMRRQRRLKEGMRLTTMLSEAAIRQQVGGPEVLCDQLRQITRVVQEFDVIVQVVPFLRRWGDQFHRLRARRRDPAVCARLRVRAGSSPPAEGVP